MVNSLKIEPPFLDRLVMNLSGGNQQKVVLARWLLARSDILVFDEPTLWNRRRALKQRSID